MSFMDKFKSGVKEAGNKAKIVVEVNRLKMQNSSKQGEIDKHLQEIGRMVYEAETSGGGTAGLNADLAVRWAPLVDRVNVLKEEIQANLLEIRLITNEKSCPKCGYKAAADTQFCAQCGSDF
ncbi:zinc ribbon domain-containing protein [Paenibacillus sambharensis]|uniref:Zinc ribbon domain-containing protein n=1 Tax=Paenibacillus sambharensis TaxID=1803190 RepID=A0A2W1LSJ9_9BACL|nr:zinc ribbon domain-containing protein [Paenibacillus sambharensis]PZD94417.1 zinc ribbon domain-containing protein [Paenibacillus sambharensis]